MRRRGGPRLAVVGAALGQILLAAPTAAAVGLAYGWAAWWAYVIGLGPLLIGLAAGAASGLAALVLRGRVATSAHVAAGLAALVGCGGLELMADRHFRTAWRQDFARSRYAASGAGPEEAFQPEERAFWATKADERLAEQMRRQVGFDGFAARWWVRAGEGVRLFGPWRGGRGLPLGRPGAILWALGRIALAMGLASLVLRRIERRRARADPDAPQASHGTAPAVERGATGRGAPPGGSDTPG